MCTLVALSQMEMSQVHFLLLRESGVNTKLEIIFEVNNIKENREIFSFPSKKHFDLPIIFLPPFM